MVLAQMPLILLLIWRWRASALRRALGWLATALVGQAFYDYFGKKCCRPPVAEIGQGIAAGSLVFYGAMCTADRSRSLSGQLQSPAARC